MVTVLFDIDGTLIQTGGAGQRAFADTFRTLFHIDKISADVLFAGRSDRAIAEDLMTVHGIVADDGSWLRFVNAFVPRLVEVLPECQGAVLPGVIELLDELEKSDQVLLGLLTGNIAEGARAKLSYYQLWNRFAFGGFGDDWTDRNDIAAAALSAARSYSSQSQLEPQRNHDSESESVIVIGDTPADVQCARSIGAYAIAVCTGGASREQLQAEEPDLLLDDLTGFEVIIQQINSVIV